MGHTPGPWYVVRYEGNWFVESDSGSRHRVIASVPLSDEEKADAALIAAAPEMLDALEAIEADSDDPISRRIAGAAIKKAQGEA